MRLLFLPAVVSLLCACATPPPVVDTARLVAKMSAQMDGSVSAYIKALEAVRADDASRLQGIRTRTERRTVATEDELQIMVLAEQSQPVKLFKAVAVAPPAEPPLNQKPGAPPARVSFDRAPLQSVAQIANDIAAPKNGKEQLIVLLKFAQQVNDDLAKAAGKTD